MRFTTTFVALVAAASGADAWIAQFYEHSGGNCVYGNGRGTMRRITGGGEGNCYTFGNAMPGTGCTEFTNSGVSGRGCGNPPGWRPHSFAFGGGRNCVLYMHPNCQGPWWDSGSNSQCQQRSNNGDSTIRSFRCYG